MEGGFYSTPRRLTLTLNRIGHSGDRVANISVTWRRSALAMLMASGEAAEAIRPCSC